MRRYSEVVKADVRRRMSPPHRQSVARISEELGIHVMTLYKWRKDWRLHGEVVPASEKEPTRGMGCDRQIHRGSRNRWAVAVGLRSGTPIDSEPNDGSGACTRSRWNAQGLLEVILSAFPPLVSSPAARAAP